MTDKYRHAKAERSALERDLKRILDLKDEREFMKFLREHGIKDENPRFSRLVKAFREGKIDQASQNKP
jgi:hypothetical protein